MISYAGIIYINKIRRKGGAVDGTYLAMTVVNTYRTALQLFDGRLVPGGMFQHILRDTDGMLLLEGAHITIAVLHLREHADSNEYKE